MSFLLSLAVQAIMLVAEMTIKLRHTLTLRSCKLCTHHCLADFWGRCSGYF